MFFLYLLPRLPCEISLAVFGLIAGLFLAVHGGMQAYAESTGVPGTVHVTDCRPAAGGWDELWTDGWACEGSFDADDHTVRIEGIAVDGPGAHTAAQDGAGGWKWPALTGVVILAFTAWRIRTLTLLLRLRRALRWNSGASTAGPSWLVAQFPAPLWGAAEPYRTSPDPLSASAQAERRQAQAL